MDVLYFNVLSFPFSFQMIEKDTILQQELTLFAKFMTNSEELQSVFAHLASQMNAFVRSSDQ